MKGLPSSLCNRAFADTCLPAFETAKTIQRLVEAGAYIVGMTKLSSMLSKEDPNEAIDYQAPFNPRGDGYQSSAGSCGGSAAAIASYGWLDFAIGSDSRSSLGV